MSDYLHIKAFVAAKKQLFIGILRHLSISNIYLYKPHIDCVSFQIMIKL